MKKRIRISLLVTISAISLIFGQQKQNFSMDTSASDTMLYTEIPSQFTQITKDVDPSRKQRALKKLRNSGIVITSIGSAFAIAGIILATKNDPNSYYDPHTGEYEKSFSGEIDEFVGTIAVIGGSAGALAGATMWIIGQHQLNKINKNVSFSVLPNSVYFAYRF